MKTNKILAIVLAVAMVFSSMTISVFAASDSWDGTADTSWYNGTDKTFTLTTAEQLAGLAQLTNAGNAFSGKTVVLDANVDLGGKEWTPIGMSDKRPFSGTFDGKGNTVSNLSITTGNDYVGLFGFTTNGEIKNLVVENAAVKGRVGVGAVSGCPYTSKYTNITVKGTVKIDGMSYVGGVLGRNVYADVTNVHVIADDNSYVNANSIEDGLAYRTYVGGVIGFMGEGPHVVSNVSSNIAVYGSTIDVGGIVGIAHYGNSFENITCTAPVIAVTDCDDTDNLKEVGGIAGVWNDGGATVNMVNCTVADATTISATDPEGNAIDYDFTAQKVAGAAYSGKTDEETAKKLYAPTETMVAKVGKNTYYATLDAALAASTVTDTITLLADAELYIDNPDVYQPYNFLNVKEIDLNNHTMNITREGDFRFSTCTIKNGNIVVDAAVGSKIGDGIFYMFGDNVLTLDNVKLTAKNLECTSIFSMQNNSGLKLQHGTEVIVEDCTLSGIIIGYNSGENIIDNSKITATNLTGKGFTHGKYTVKGTSEITLDGVTKDGFYLGMPGNALNIQDTAKVDITLNANEDGRYGINVNGDATYTKAATATVNATVYIKPTEENLAKKVKVVFEPTDKQEVYNIFVEADAGETINRLSTAQFKFALTGLDEEGKDDESVDMGYTLSPAKNVTITEDLGEDDAYVFNYNGVDEKDRTGAKLLLGTVKFDGVGKFKFEIDTEYKNQVHTASLSDNIEIAYVPGVTDRNLDLGTGITGEIKEATRAINVVIAFNNEIMEKNAAYTEMSVTVAGGADNQAVTKVIGADDDTTTEDIIIDTTGDVVTATVPFEVTVPYRYTITVKGEGYRTATYTTVVGVADEALTLNFWNNVKDADAEIEKNEARSAMTKNFLAGDIVKDNTINKYDLSAVVSYFGTRQAAVELNKYDLNRDGNIDSEDIAYVLVSFGE